MGRFVLFIVMTIFSFNAFAQRIHVGVFGGLANYQGDLVDRWYAKKQTNGSIGVTVSYELTDQVFLRGGFTFARINGADYYSKDSALKARNLSFESAISEFSAVAEYYVFNLYDQRYSPYVFAGLAVYHFDPYTYFGGNKVYLHPLSTEGQGLPGYAVKPYSLTQVALPIGGGLKFALNDNIRIGAEIGFRKLFTDYLDDVSSNYADPADLLAAKGQLAVDLAYRGDEVPTGSPIYPQKGEQRGGVKNKDWYYFTGLHLTMRIGNGGSGRGYFGRGRRKEYGCPANPM